MATVEPNGRDSSQCSPSHSGSPHWWHHSVAGSRQMTQSPVTGLPFRSPGRCQRRRSRGSRPHRTWLFQLRPGSCAGRIRCRRSRAGPGVCSAGSQRSPRRALAITVETNGPTHRALPLTSPTAQTTTVTNEATAAVTSESTTADQVDPAASVAQLHSDLPAARSNADSVSTLACAGSGDRGQRWASMQPPHSPGRPKQTISPQWWQVVTRLVPPQGQGASFCVFSIRWLKIIEYNSRIVAESTGNLTVSQFFRGEMLHEL